MNKEKQIVPELRFPEFEKDGEWEGKSIDKLSNKVTAGGTPSTKEDKYWGGNIRWMNSGELNLKVIYEVDGRITKEGLDNSSTKLIPVDCVLIGLAGQGKTRGTVAINKVELCTNQSIASIFPNKKVFDSTFLYHNLDNRYKELRELSTGGEGRGGLNLGIIKEIKVPIPISLKEQQKIANCLSSLDEVISAETEKLELLQDHKKGLLQQLFPQEGETQPKYRFPEFKNEGDWEEKELKTFLEFQTGFPFKSSGFNKENKGIRLIKNRDLKADDRIVYFEGSYNDDYLVNDGDILVGMDGDFSPVKWNKGLALLNQRVGRIRTNNDTNDFIFHFLSIHLKIIEHNTPSTTVKHLSHSTVEKLKVPIPSTIKEQQKIGKCLSSVDNLIEAQTLKIDRLQTHKIGLLQQLFPNINDVVV
ncbi:restriction endonuclease subunit S [Hwangdonia sp.]|uniref:restriction endonuclease subunit S n=1 Tax=Hwangdonia sp. TaxID=1883432 RepID=UPI003AB43DF3